MKTLTALIMGSLLISAASVHAAQGVPQLSIQANNGYDGIVDMADCPSVTLRVDDVSKAKGWGSHFSLAHYENGYGGANVECHLTPGHKGTVIALCYDGVLGGNVPHSQNRTNSFQVQLGQRKDIDFVEWHIGQGGVSVSAQLRTNSAYTHNRIPYLVNSYFPIHPDIGFCGDDNFNGHDTLYWKESGNLAGHPGRHGKGYRMEVTTP